MGLLVLHPQYDCTDQGQPRPRLPNTDGICKVASLAGWSRIYSEVTVSFECQYGSCAILYLSRVSVRCQKLGVAFGYLICGARNKHLCEPHDAVLCSVWSCPIHFFDEVAAHSYRIQMEGGGGSLPRQFKLVLH